MNPDDLANQIEALIVSANERYASQIQKVQDDLYAAIAVKLKDIELDPDGYILQSAKNRQIIDDVESLVDDMLSGKYQSQIENQLTVIPQIDDLNSEYFSSVDSSFKSNRNFIKSLQQQMVEKIESNLLHDGLTYQVRQPISDILNQNINSGGSFSGFLDQLRVFIKGDPDRDGRLLSYSRGILRDALFQYSRAYQESVTSDLKLDWYMYAGGLMDSSREFCREHAGNFYRRDVVESWADEDWQGKNPLTTSSSIFVFVGGYSCTHSLIPVHESMVPAEDK